MRYLLAAVLVLSSWSCKRDQSDKSQGVSVEPPAPKTRPSVPLAVKPATPPPPRPSAGPSWPDSVRTAAEEAAHSAVSQPARYAVVPRVIEKPAKPEAVYQGKPASYWLTILPDKDYRTRRVAALALAELSPSGVDADGSGVIAQYLNDPDELTRVRIALAYYEATKDPKSASVLAEIMERDGNDEHFVACIEAARAAGRMGHDADAALPVMLNVARKYAYPNLGGGGYPQLQEFGYACAKAAKEIDPNIDTNNLK